MEYPTNSSKREIRKQQDVSIVIKGLQDVALEASVEKIEEIQEAEELGWNWFTYCLYTRDL